MYSDRPGESTSRVRSSCARGFVYLAAGVFSFSQAALALEAPTGAKSAQAASDAVAYGSPPSVQMTADIDRALGAAWQAAGIAPAATADDAEFLRRVYLDLTGKIPSVTQARAFLADTRPTKRQQLVDDLLASAIYAAHFANTWRDILLAGTNPELRVAVPELESWLRLRFAANTPYNQLVAELVGTNYVGSVRTNQRMTSAVPSPVAFFQANERKPENLAASLSSVFLGVQVECAQCHDHPFARWKQDDFWSFAAFFRGLDNGMADTTTIALADSFDRKGLAIPGTEATVTPRYLDGAAPDWRPELGNRAMLARWMTGTGNPFFGRASVNRVWELFFGRPLASAADAVERAPSAHEELLDALAGQFVASRYDVKQLIRAIVLSRAYQLSSVAAETEKPLSHFACMPVRRLTADQLYDSLVQATGFYEPPPPRNAQPFAPDSARVDFRNKFAEEGKQRGESQTSIVQALALMNGKLTGDATSLARSKTLAAAVEMPGIDTRERIEILFLATLSRPPTADEAAQYLAYVKDGPEAQRLADAFWVLLNSAEFATNH